MDLSPEFAELRAQKKRLRGGKESFRVGDCVCFFDMTQEMLNNVKWTDLSMMNGPQLMEKLTGYIIVGVALTSYPIVEADSFNLLLEDIARDIYILSIDRFDMNAENTPCGIRIAKLEEISKQRR